MKLLKWLLVLAILGGGGYLAWYLISPLFITIEVNDEFPSLDLIEESTPEVEKVPMGEAEEVRDIATFNDRTDAAQEEEEDFSDMTFDEAMDMMKDKVKEMDDESPMDVKIVTDAVEEKPEVVEEPKPVVRIVDRAKLVPHGGHFVEGDALIIQSGDQFILRYQDYETVNGPRLNVYLATDTKATDFIDLGRVKGTKGSVNYQIPAGTDLEKYNYALIWCVPFRVLFNSAEFEL